MKLRYLFLCALFSATALVAQEAITVIKAGTLIDGHSDQPLKNKFIVIRGNRIDSIADAAPSGVKVIDLGAATVLPGMVESHTHMFLQGEDEKLGG
jgi:imidazolonepropionase-like amidohydrolase